MVSDELKAAMRVLLNTEYVSMRDYDEALGDLRRCASAEHRRMTSDEGNNPYLKIVSSMCYNFIVDVYFGGRYPQQYDDRERYLMAQSRRRVFQYVCQACHIENGRKFYADEVSEARVRLMDRPAVCEYVESNVSSKLAEALRTMRDAKQ